jgi:hypothetical protein
MIFFFFKIFNIIVNSEQFPTESTPVTPFFETPGEKPGGSRAAQRPGPHWNLQVSLRVSRKRSYGWLNAVDEKYLL